jgi:hypothetical protein
MIIGHYATALIPHQRLPAVPLWVFLLAANLSDFAWLLFALLGLEAPRPDSMFAASFRDLEVQMPYSHDLVPAGLWALVAGAIAWGVTRSRAAMVWCAALVVFHEACDLVAGFEHHILGPSTASVGLDLYGRAPEAAILLEAALGAGCVLWFLRQRAASGRPVSIPTARALYLVFILGALAWLPIARTPLGSLLGLG